MPIRHLFPTLAAALFLLATFGCPEREGADGFDLEEPADTHSPNAGRSDTDASDTPEPTFPDTTGTPCWPTQHATPQNTGRSPCEGPVEPEQSRKLFSKSFADESPDPVFTRIGPSGLLAVAHHSPDRDAPVVRVFDTGSDTRTSWPLQGDGVELRGLGVTSTADIVTLERHGTSDNSTAVVRSFDSTGSTRWSRTLPLPDDVEPRPHGLHVFGDTREHGIRAVVHTDTDRTFVFHLDHAGTLRETARDRHVRDRHGYGFRPGHRAALLGPPADSGDHEVRLEALDSGPDGPRRLDLNELGFDLEDALGHPDTTYARPLFIPGSNDLLLLLTSDEHSDFNWLCRLSYPDLTDGSCAHLPADGELVGFGDDTLLADGWLVGLERNHASPGLGAARLDELDTAADDHRILVDGDHVALGWVADARDAIYALVRPRQTDVHTELAATRPDGTQLWRTDVGLPDGYPESFVVGDDHLYVTYIHSRTSPTRLEIYQVGQ